jgi:predicted ATPase/class 3 adenylate cyclase
MPNNSLVAAAATETVTIMFTDLVDSTGLRIALGEARFAQVMAEHDALVHLAVTERGGKIVKHTGDGVMASFAAASQGVAAAVDIQRGLTFRGGRETPSMRVRIGVGAGDVAERLGDYHGVAVVEAARLCAAASNGQILASDAVRGLAGSHGGFDYVHLGELDLKGLPGLASVAVRWAEEAPVARPPGSVQGSLPASVDRFIGRSRDVAATVELVRQQRIVTLTGTPGSGKTRLALEAAAKVAPEFSDGAWLVSLADMSDEHMVMETTAAALGIRNTGEPGQALRAHLSQRGALLVLDNCEHVVEAVAPFVADLLADCPGLHVLATSREPLQVPGEREYQVDPLPLDEAEELFLERRPAGLALTDADREAVARICDAVDGIPLAVELAAARLRVFSPVQVADRLDDQLATLTGGGRHRPDRQQTLRAALDWSYDLLTPDERVVFRRLGIFAGGFTLDAAQQVVAGDGVDPADVPYLVEQLATRSLVELGLGLGLHLRMLEPVRHYARDRLAGSGEQHAVAVRHVEWVRTLSAELGRGFFADQRAAMARASAEHANICHALDFALGIGRVHDAARIVAATAYLWIMAGQPDGRHWADRTLDACPADAPAGVRGDAVFAASMFAVNEGDERRAVLLLREARSCYVAASRGRSHAWVLTWFGRAGRAGTTEIDGHAPEHWFALALEEFEALEDAAGAGWALTLLSRCALRAGDLDLAHDRARRALDLAERGGIEQVAAAARRRLATIAHARGDAQLAEELIARAASGHEDSGDRWHQAVALATAAAMAIGRRDLDRAAGSLLDAMEIVDELPEDEATVNVLVAAFDFLVHVGRGPEVASIVGGLASDDFALLERVTLIQGPEHLADEFAHLGGNAPGRYSLRNAVAMAATIMAGWTANRAQA